MAVLEQPLADRGRQFEVRLLAGQNLVCVCKLALQPEAVFAGYVVHAWNGGNVEVWWMWNLLECGSWLEEQKF